MTRRTPPAAPLLRLFASLDTTAAAWRTWRRHGTPGWTDTPRAWPRTGVLRGGHAYELTDRRPARRTTGAPRLMPTPTAADGTGGPGTSPHRTGGLNLRTLVTRLPEPPGPQAVTAVPDQPALFGTEDPAAPEQASGAAVPYQAADLFSGTADRAARPRGTREQHRPDPRPDDPWPGESPFGPA